MLSQQRLRSLEPTLRTHPSLICLNCLYKGTVATQRAINREY